MAPPRTLEGKVAIVTGASRGIGVTLAHDLASRGAKIVITYTSDKSKAGVEDLQKRIAQVSESHAVQADLRLPESAEKIINETRYVQLSMRDATEFLSRKDYTDNWQSEMHETFCFWDFDDWKRELQSVGFAIHPQSTAFTNTWIVDNRWRD